MSAFTFTEAMIADLNYEFNDADIWNDILLIEGAVGAEQLIRGISTVSIELFGRRSKRVERPLVATDVIADILVRDQLDRYCCYDDGLTEVQIPAKMKMDINGFDDTLVTQILSLVVSDFVTVQINRMGMNEDYYIDGIELTLQTGILQAKYSLVQKMS